MKKMEKSFIFSKRVFFCSSNFFWERKIIFCL